jgi:two-component system response regulator
MRAAICTAAWKDGPSVGSQAVEILLVEDNPNDLRLTLAAFAEHRTTQPVRVVRDGEEALEFLFCTGAYAHRRMDRPPRLVVLDLKLPKLDGIEVLQRIKADPQTRSIPVVVLTGSREERDLARSYDLGANSYVVKPVDFDQFSEAIRDLGLYWLLRNEPPPLLPPEAGT